MLGCVVKPEHSSLSQGSDSFPSYRLWPYAGWFLGPSLPTSNVPSGSWDATEMGHCVFGAPEQGAMLVCRNVGEGMTPTSSQTVLGCLKRTPVLIQHLPLPPHVLTCFELPGMNDLGMPDAMGDLGHTLVNINPRNLAQVADVFGLVT